MVFQRKALIAVAIAVVLIPLVWIAVWRLSTAASPKDEPGFQLETGDTSDQSSDALDRPDDHTDDVEPSLVEGVPLGGTILAEGTLSSMGEEISGQVQLIQVGDVYVVRMKNFKITDGEDHFVYLSDRDELDGLEYLGEVRANVGDFNYDVDGNVGIAAFEEVLIWNEATEQIVAVAELIRQ